VPPSPVHAGQGLLYQVTSFVRVRREVPADTEQLPALAVHEGREPLVSFALHGPPSSVLAIPLPRPTDRQGCHAHPPDVRGDDPEPTASITWGGKGTLLLAAHNRGLVPVLLLPARGRPMWPL